MGLVDQWKRERREKAQSRAWEAFDRADGAKLVESVRSGASVNECDGSGLTMAHRAIQSNKTTLIEALDRAGADWNLPLVDGRNALHLAVEGGHGWWVNAMLERKVEMERTTLGGMTPLHLAARTGASQIIRMLDQAGASWKAKDRQGLSPLDILLRLHPALHATWKRVLEERR